MKNKLMLKEIEACRLEMQRLAKLHSLTSKEVVYMSVRLDHLLNEYEELKQREQQPALKEASYC
ncbi:aspartyl-phosphate phosphatase Spo0E family protein [Halobacillus salinarum]|uniref:Aspartyl-phosphate phosphatase Spo0E family protein n=1 Tax=Halobacillus salinarum TaxID=2932257 RepID=A0ABY4EJF3_9BACI|nr:aspartyl-phosphate phosphatase Spo0E family protein [Halobacillus salinarum]UOQ44565.1 aspartyl-phosphate phosphatase Spo0E family protein [Halobacillus salinarum]